MEEGREEEGEAVTGGRVTDLGHDLRDGDQLIGTTGEFIATFDYGVGIDYSHRYALCGVAVVVVVDDNEDSG